SSRPRTTRCIAPSGPGETAWWRGRTRSAASACKKPAGDRAHRLIIPIGYDRPVVCCTAPAMPLLRTLLTAGLILPSVSLHAQGDEPSADLLQRFDTYEQGYLKLERGYHFASEVRQGREHRQIDLPQFYGLVGRPDLAAEYVRRIELGDELMG